MPEPVRLMGDPILKVPCAEVELSTLNTTLPAILDSMAETMRAENGIGLAANQIGHSLRVFIMDDGKGSYNAFINPQILLMEDLVELEGEACLSLPGTSANTKRYSEVQLEWYDKHGVQRVGWFLNLQAFAIQHEMDHLNGKLYVEQLEPMKKNLVVKRHKKFMKEKNRSK